MEQVRKRQYRLPSGEVTWSQDDWARSWDVLGKSVVKFFPGYHVGGMDPGLILHPDDYKGESISLSIRACKALLTNSGKCKP